MKRRLTTSQGLSLIELLVAIGLFGLLTVLLGRFLGLTLSGTGETNARAALHREAMTVMGLIVSDMERASLPYFLSLERADAAQPLTVGAILTSGTDDSAAFLWEREMTLYRWLPNETELQRVVAATSSAWPTDDPAFPTEELIAEALAAQPSSFKRLSTQVSAFDLVTTEGALVKISFTLQDLGDREFSVARIVRVKNG